MLMKYTTKLISFWSLFYQLPVYYFIFKYNIGALKHFVITMTVESQQ